MGPFSHFDHFLVAFLVFLSLQGANASCPRGWVKRENQCFGFFIVPLSWPDAEIACQSFGENGHLASIHNQDDMQVLSNHLNQIQNVPSHVWIGLYDHGIGSGNNRQFKWTDSTTGRYTPWAPGEPNNGRNIEHCVELYSKEYMEWKNEDCSIKQPYLCKYTL